TSAHTSLLVMLYEPVAAFCESARRVRLKECPGVEACSAGESGLNDVLRTWRISEVNLLGRARRKVRNVRSFRRAARDARAKTPGLNTRVSRNDRMMERSQPDQYFVAGQAGFEAIQRGLDAAGIVTAQTIL